MGDDLRDSTLGYKRSLKEAGNPYTIKIESGSAQPGHLLLSDLYNQPVPAKNRKSKRYTRWRLMSVTLPQCHIDNYENNDGTQTSAA